MKFGVELYGTNKQVNAHITHGDGKTVDINGYHNIVLEPTGIIHGLILSDIFFTGTV
jgi:hypothetical protein